MLLDIGAGMLVALGVSKLFSLQLTPFLVGGGITFALVMDADFLLHLARGGSHRSAWRHREVLHYPLVYVPLGSALAFAFGRAPWALLFSISSLAHFLHDSIGIGWGVPWLWPFSKDRYTFLYSYQPPGRPAFPRKLLYVWHHRDLDELEAKYGDPDWLRNVYGKAHPFAIVEFLFLIAALFLLLRYG